ncbi:MAG: glycosyltransferase family 39 protein [Thermoanaerobaculia bacterium]|nr:glycosyltransferase family 39 protein [Thermoanaerobaculia bacterium]
MRAPLHILRSPAAGATAVALLLAFAFLGSRAIWDPDEGRYTNVALQMLESGNYLDLARHHETGHWTKPPATYWAIAASVATFGRSAGAARLPAALAYLASVALVAWAARRLQPGTEALAALVFATMLLPFAAANLITTDFLLAAFQGLAMVAWVESRFGASRAPGRWLLLMWAGFALAFLVKGPPALLPLLAVLAVEWLAPAPGRVRRRCWPIGLLLFAVLALPWFVAVVLRHAGLLAYYLGTEIAERVAGAELDRHPEWYGWLLVYAPTLAVGALPWTATLWRAVGRLVARARSWRDPEARRADAPLLALAAWIALPLIVFCIARSRLPLYLLPLFVPLSLLVARERRERGRGLPRWRPLALWVVLLLSLRLAAAHWPTHKDARRWAAAIRERAPAMAIEEVVFVEDMARYGLHLHLGAAVERISLDPRPKPPFAATWDDDFASELAERERRVWIAKGWLWPEISRRAGAVGCRLEPLGEPYEGRVIFLVRPAAQEGRISSP